MIDTLSDECITPFEVADPAATDPAYAPANLTASTATVFADTECTGDTWNVLDPGKKGGAELKFRSGIFS